AGTGEAGTLWTVGRIVYHRQRPAARAKARGREGNADYGGALSFDAGRAATRCKCSTRGHAANVQRDALVVHQANRLSNARGADGLIRKSKTWRIECHRGNAGATESDNLWTVRCIVSDCQ